MPSIEKKPNRAHRRHSDSQDTITEAIEAGTLPRRAYRLSEVAAMLGVSRWHLDKMIDEGVIGTVPLGSLRVVPAAEIDRLLKVGLERREAQG